MQKIPLLKLDGCYVVCAFFSRSQKPRSNPGEKGLARGGLCFCCLAKSSATRCFFCTTEQLVRVFVVRLDLGYVVSPHDYQHIILSKIWNHVECFALARLTS